MELGSVRTTGIIEKKLKFERERERERVGKDVAKYEE